MERVTWGQYPWVHKSALRPSQTWRSPPGLSPPQNHLWSAPSKKLSLEIKTLKQETRILNRCNMNLLQTIKTNMGMIMIQFSKDEVVFLHVIREKQGMRKNSIKQTADMYLALTWASRASSVGSLRSSFVLPFSVNKLTYMCIKGFTTNCKLWIKQRKSNNTTLKDHTNPSSEISISW